MNTSSIKFLNLSIVGIIIFSSCVSRNSSSKDLQSSNRSTSTGWDYNDYKNGGFEKTDDVEQETGPGLVLIEGGTFKMGNHEQDVMFDAPTSPQPPITVDNFYMDKTEVTNLHWLEYMYWMKRVYNKSYPHVFKKSLPDTLSWRTALGYREKYVESYLRAPQYQDYPVVGVSWLQATEFCKWRTDRVNEAILVREGIIQWHFADVNNSDVDAGNNKVNSAQSKPENMFSTENYLNGNYTVSNEGIKKDVIANGKDKDDKEKYLDKNGKYKYEKGKKYAYNVGAENKPEKKGKGYEDIPRDPYQLKNYDPLYADLKKGEVICLGKRGVKIEDGILLPSYRLPTEAEWEFAAAGLIGNLEQGEGRGENITDRRIYPWDGHYVRQEEQKYAGIIQANFMRGKGDMMGLAGNQNDGGSATVRVDEYWPNDNGLYNMAGNVSEWVMDNYRPTVEPLEGFMPFRGNVYKTQLLVPDGLHEKPVKAMENLYDVHGMKEYVNELARVMFMSKANRKVDGINGSFTDEYTKDAYKKRLAVEEQKENYITCSNVIANTIDTVSFESVNKGKNKANLKFTWSVFPSTQMTFKNNKPDNDSVNILFSNPGKYVVSLSIKDGKNTIPVREIEIEVRDNSKNSFVNNKGIDTKINQRQDPKNYRFNSLSKSYISNNKSFSDQERRQFLFLDTLNMHLDTAIFLMNANRQTIASAYIENAFFGNNSLVKIKKDDIRENKNLDDFKPGSMWGGSDDDTRVPLFGGSYLDSTFTNFKNDPTITTWIITLRNGLTEFITETKGKQRWRNVTVEENNGRLNYRKDDYRDYLDGDLESSIYHNNEQRKKDINEGIRDPKQVVYQNQFENKDLDGKDIAFGSSGAPVTLISDKSRVYKGGSWADLTYWLSIGTRRYLDEDKSSCTIGFRCAMDRLGGRPKR